jgi:hypothetical protein
MAISAFRRARRPRNFWCRSTYDKSSFRDAPLGAGPESITTNRGYGFRAHRFAMLRNDREENFSFRFNLTTRRANQSTRCPAPFAKIFPFTSGANHFHVPAVRSRKRGVGHRHERWDRMRWTQSARKTNALGLRTVKSCGPDAPTLAFKLAEQAPRATVAKKPVAEESAKEPVKTIARGMPGDSGVT